MAWLSVSGANRDPRVFDDPTAFKLDRYGNKHLGFAGGPHRCLGAHLARQEMAIALEEWHRRIPDYRVGRGAGLRARRHAHAVLPAARVAGVRRATCPV